VACFVNVAVVGACSFFVCCSAIAKDLNPNESHDWPMDWNAATSTASKRRVASVKLMVPDRVQTRISRATPPESKIPKTKLRIPNLPEAGSRKASLPEMELPEFELPQSDLPGGRSKDGQARARTHANPGKRPVVIVIGGDLGLGGSDQPVSAIGAYRHGARYNWSDLTRHIGKVINGDINFANLETVVTKNNRLTPSQKKFRFRSHPAGVRHLIGVGFNALSLANNHAIDFGIGGMRDTLGNIRKLENHGLKLWSGLGVQSNALQPGSVNIRGARIRLMAVGIGGLSPRKSRLGMLNFRFKPDLEAAIGALSSAPAQYRIFSAHYGRELQVRPSASAIKVFRDQVLRAGDIDLVIGHHAHTVAGVQRVDGKLIFYGMGNLLHPGMQNMARMNSCRDYGLIARLHLSAKPNGRLAARAIEVIPLTDMHLRAKPMPPQQAAKRIEILNFLAQNLDDSTTRAKGVRFQIGKDGTGLYCTSEGRSDIGAIGKLCANWKPMTPLAAVRTRQINYACNGATFVARLGGGKTKRGSAHGNRTKMRARRKARTPHELADRRRRLARMLEPAD